MGRFIHQEEMVPRPLPNNWKNVSNMKALTYQELLDLGWFPIEEPGEKPAHDTIHEELSESLTFQEDRAVLSYDVVRKEDIETVASFASKKIKEIKADCEEAILSLYPEYKQRNLIAKGVELLDKMISTRLSEEQEAERAALYEVFNDIQTKRTRSNDLEADIQTIIDDINMTDDEKRIAINDIKF